MLKQFALAVIASAAIALPAIAAPATPAPSADAAAKTANPEDANPLLPTKADMEKAHAEREAGKAPEPCGRVHRDSGFHSYPVYD